MENPFITEIHSKVQKDKPTISFDLSLPIFTDDFENENTSFDPIILSSQNGHFRCNGDQMKDIASENENTIMPLDSIENMNAVLKPSDTLKFSTEFSSAKFLEKSNLETILVPEFDQCKAKASGFISTSNTDVVDNQGMMDVTDPQITPSVAVTKNCIVSDSKFDNNTIKKNSPIAKTILLGSSLTTGIRNIIVPHSKVDNDTIKKLEPTAKTNNLPTASKKELLPVVTSSVISPPDNTNEVCPVAETLCDDLDDVNIFFRTQVIKTPQISSSENNSSDNIAIKDSIGKTHNAANTSSKDNPADERVNEKMISTLKKRNLPWDKTKSNLKRKIEGKLIKVRYNI